MSPLSLVKKGVIVTESGCFGVSMGIRPPARWLAVRAVLQVTPSVSTVSSVSQNISAPSTQVRRDNPKAKKFGKDILS